MSWVIDLHSRVRSSGLQCYYLTMLFGIDGSMVASFLIVKETPDGLGSFIGIRKLAMITDPDSRKITLERLNFISVTFWWTMEVKWEMWHNKRRGEVSRQETQLHRPSAVDRRVVLASVIVEVEVTNSSTVGDVTLNIIPHADTIAGREGSHLALSTRMPDDTLDETLASADGVEVDLGSSGVESHGCFADELSIGWIRQRSRGTVPLVRVSHEERW